MIRIQELLSQPWVERVGWTLIHFLWQGAAIALLYAAARWRAGETRGGQLRYAMACAALTAMIAAPLITFALLGPSAPRQMNPYVGRVPVSSSTLDVASASITSVQTVAIRVWRDEVMPWLVAVWLTGAIVFWVRLLAGWVIATRMRSMFVRPAPFEWQQKLDLLRSRIEVFRPVRLLISALVQTPMVVGWLRPVVLVPIGALAGLPPEHVEALLAHELAHIRRHDYLVNILQSITESLLFYHPAVWWISGHIRNEREVCCDEVAVSISGDAITYARALAGLETCRPAHFVPVLAASGGSLRDRIARLLNQPSRIASAQPTPGAVVAAVLIVVAAYGAFAQPAVLPSFEAATIKPNTLGGGHTHMTNPTGWLKAQMTTKVLIQMAFGLKGFQVSGGPSWLDNDNYDFSARTATPVTLNAKAVAPYLQSLLNERFHLKYHRETREFPVYWLVTAKSGAKLTPHKGEDSGESTNSNGIGHSEKMSGKNLSMAAFAGFLADRMDRPVIDKTGISGKFDVQMDWSPDQGGNFPGPSVFTALQEQLGLRLESNKGPVEILVVDSVDKPSEN